MPRCVTKKRVGCWTRCRSCSRKGPVLRYPFFQAQRAAKAAEQEVLVARAALKAAEAKLEGYQVKALIAGTIGWLEVYPGMVSRPGTTVWGEIVDLSKEVDVCCEVKPELAESMKEGGIAEVRRAGRDKGIQGRVSFVGILADKGTGLVQVLIRLDSLRKKRWRYGERVQVRFTGRKGEDSH